MAWMKRPRRSPVRLTSEHLDTIVAPDDYQQPYGSGAKKALGYPFEGLAGRLEVREWSAGNLICLFVSWSGPIAKRSFYNGSWGPWVDTLGKVIS